MSVRDTEAQIKSRVWKAIAQSEIDLSMLPKATLDALVDLVASSALLEMDEQLTDVKRRSGAISPPDMDDLEEGERVLWEGRPFLSLVTHYRLTSERIRIEQGLFGKDREDIELIKIQDIDQTQTMGERLLNLGDITIRSHDPSDPLIVLENISDVQRVHELLRRAMLDARKRNNFAYREEM